MPKQPPRFHPFGYNPNKRDRERKAKAEHDKNRPNANQRGYTYKWHKARTRFIKQNPLCIHCDAKGIIRPATEVDHITPHRGDMELFWDQKDLQRKIRNV